MLNDCIFYNWEVLISLFFSARKSAGIYSDRKYFAGRLIEEQDWGWGEYINESRHRRNKKIRDTWRLQSVSII